MCRPICNLDSWERIQKGPHRVWLLVTYYAGALPYSTKQAGKDAFCLVVDVCSPLQISLTISLCVGVMTFQYRCTSADTYRVRGTNCDKRDHVIRSEVRKVLTAETTEIHLNQFSH